MGAKSDDRQAKTLILKNGSKHKIKGSNGRFWFCEGTQFRKSNPDIKEIIYAEAEATDDAEKKAPKAKHRAGDEK